MLGLVGTLAAAGSACGSDTPNGDSSQGGATSASSGNAGSSDTGGAGSSSGGNTGTGGTGGSVQPMSGSYTIVGVGSWGLRGITSDGADWTICQNPSTGDDHSPDLLRQVGYGDGVFVAVGGDQNSMVMRSLDGIHWEEDLHPTTSCAGESYPPSCTNWMGGVAYGDGVWLAGGGNGALMRSTDAAVTWTGLHPANGVNAVRSIAYGSGTFVAGTDGGVVSVSSDAGDSWTHHPLWAHGMNITYGDGVFVAKGQNWNGSGFDYGCSVSIDVGASWSPCAPAILDAGTALYADGQWLVAASDAYHSSADALMWSMQSAPNFPQRFLFTGEQWIGTSGDNAWTSSNLTDWQQSAQNVPGFRSMVGGLVLDANLPVENVPVCQDNG
jgi:hypothetical protein